MLTMGAFILLSTILVTFYRLLGESGQTLDAAQAGITKVSLATSYMQLAQALHFDHVTDSTFVTDVSALTLPTNLRREPGEDSLALFNDLDDFNGYEIVEEKLGGNLGTYHTRFVVSYVNPDDVNQISTSRTFVKRMDMTITRIVPPSTDTLRVSMIMGYWHFTNAL